MSTDKTTYRKKQQLLSPSYNYPISLPTASHPLTTSHPHNPHCPKTPQNESYTFHPTH